jgi:hypothetical protein
MLPVLYFDDLEKALDDDIDEHHGVEELFQHVVESWCQNDLDCEEQSGNEYGSSWVLGTVLQKRWSLKTSTERHFELVLEVTYSEAFTRSFPHVEDSKYRLSSENRALP